MIEFMRSAWPRHLSLAVALSWLAMPPAHAQVVGGFDCQRGSWRNVPPTKLVDALPESTLPPPGLGEADYAELELVVDPAGAVSEVHVCQSPKALVEAAPAAARRWRYARAQAGEGERRFRTFVRYPSERGPFRQLSTEALVARLFTGLERERLEAVREIRARGTTGAIPALVEGLGSQDRVTRLWALRGLAPVAGADRAVPALSALLRDPASSWRPQERSSWTFARHVAVMLVALDGAVAALDEAVRNRDAVACETLLYALELPLSRAAPPGLAPVLAGALAEPACREAALARRWYFADDEIGPLLDLAAHEDVRVRRHILLLMGRIDSGVASPGPSRCARVEPSALVWVSDPDPKVRVQAFWWLDRCSAAGTLDAATLAAVLEAAPTASLALGRAATLLGDLGHAAHGYAPALRRAQARVREGGDSSAVERIREALELVGADTTPTQWGEENAIVEAVVRYRRERDRVGRERFYLWVRGRPANELLRVHLAVFGHQVGRGLPDWASSPFAGPPSRPGRGAPAYSVNSIRWLSDTEVEVQGGMGCGRLCMDGGTYLLQRVDRRWEVAEHRVEIVS